MSERQLRKIIREIIEADVVQQPITQQVQSQNTANVELTPEEQAIEKQIIATLSAEFSAELTSGAKTVAIAGTTQTNEAIGFAIFSFIKAIPSMLNLFSKLAYVSSNKIKTIVPDNIKKDQNKYAKILGHAGHALHEKYLSLVKFVLKPFMKNKSEADLNKLADLIFKIIFIGSIVIATGGAGVAMGAGDIIMATVEFSLVGIKIIDLKDKKSIAKNIWKVIKIKNKEAITPDIEKTANATITELASPEERIHKNYKRFKK